MKGGGAFTDGIVRMRVQDRKITLQLKILRRG